MVVRETRLGKFCIREKLKLCEEHYGNFSCRFTAAADAAAEQQPAADGAGGGVPGAALPQPAH